MWFGVTFVQRAVCAVVTFRRIAQSAGGFSVCFEACTKIKPDYKH